VAERHVVQNGSGAGLDDKPNVARYLTENRQITWVLLAIVLLWGVYGYLAMPKQKDPDIPVRAATAITPWPGTDAGKIEQLVTRNVEKTVAGNANVHGADPTSYGIKSLTLPGVSVVFVQLDESVTDTEKEFSDINLRLNQLNASLPKGAGPIQFNSGFGNTAALLLTVASPKESAVEVSLRARDIAAAIEAARTGTGGAGRASVVVALPRSVDPAVTRRGVTALAEAMRRDRFATDIWPLEGQGFVGIDMAVDAGDAALQGYVARFLSESLGVSRFQPDAWTPVVVRDPKETEARLHAARGDKYSYRELDLFTDLIGRNLQALPAVTIVQRSGVLPEQIFLTYSQEHLAALGVQPANIQKVLSARNTPIPGGVVEAGDVNVLVEPTGEFTSEDQLGGVIIARTSAGSPVYLRSVADVRRGYQTPPRFLNFYNWADEAGQWQRSRAVSLAVQMRAGAEIGQFGEAVDRVMEDVKGRLPEDLIFARVSDQPLQTEQNTDLFMTALYEAVVLVVLVAFVGFWEWRSALLMMLSMPITLALTFGMVYVLGIDLQQVSIATLIVALGLLVDDPVVAGDAIKRQLEEGKPRLVAAWLGPTQLAHAILFATITNIVAYLPFLLLSGTTGEFLYSLPVVMACALVASRLVSMTFIPMLGYYLLRAPRRPEPDMATRRTRGFTGLYYRVGRFAIRHRKLIFAGSLSILVLGGVIKTHLKDSFFPDDVQYLFYVDVWLRNDATLEATNRTAAEVEREIREGLAALAPGKRLLGSTTTFVGGGAPRFWSSVSPEPQQSNYAQILVWVNDRYATPRIAGPLQQRLSAAVPGAIIDVRQLQTNPVPYPIDIRLSGRATVEASAEAADIRTLRALSEKVKAIVRESPLVARVRDDWSNETMRMTLRVDSDRANLAGVTNQDVALSSAAGLSGVEVATVRDGDREIPVVARMQAPQRAGLSDLENLYVFSTENKNKVPLLDVASVEHGFRTERYRRLEQFRTVSIYGFPAPGALSSQVVKQILGPLREFEKTMPPGYTLEISGEYAKTKQGFRNLGMLMAVSSALIFIALTFQFRSAVKPILVFIAVPYGIVGALAALFMMGASFSFMAFLGIVALIGVIVSHIIVLFDFIEEMGRRGEPLEQALLDAGIVRLRPVMITVGATALALLPLAIHGGPLWQPLCYAQFGGLLVATFVTLLLVPVVYAIFVYDLKIVPWPAAERKDTTESAHASTGSA
jgi:multidrug efflux pump subunit AcrB